MKRLLRPFLLTLGFFFCAALIGYAWLVFQMSRGVEAARQGEPEAAAAIFESAEAPFRAVPWLSRILQRDYEKLVFDQAKVLFPRQDPELIFAKFDEAVKNSPALRDRGEFAFWMGNLLIRRAAASDDGEEALNYLKSALAEYQRGLALAPDDWDLKYNYELTRQTFTKQEQAMKANMEKVRSLLDTMRPRQKPKQEIAPEKLG
jgi:tetratricopeptide (TPR) repeat protein